MLKDETCLLLSEIYSLSLLWEGNSAYIFDTNNPLFQYFINKLEVGHMTFFFKSQEMLRDIPMNAWLLSKALLKHSDPMASHYKTNTISISERNNCTVTRLHVECRLSICVSCNKLHNCQQVARFWWVQSNLQKLFLY